MKIAYFSESPADQAALAVFAEGILGEPPEPIGMDLQTHGVTGVLSALDGVIRGVHYGTDADGLVVRFTNNVVVSGFLPVRQRKLLKNAATHVLANPPNPVE
jgi:hypothetical protein